MILGLRHTGVVVTDLDAALRFYVDLLEFKVVRRSTEQGAQLDTMLCLRDARVTTAKLACPGGGTIELLAFLWPESGSAERAIHDIGISHIALSVDDVNEEHMRLSRAGVEFLSAPVLSGSCRVAFALDPDSNFVELVQALS